MARFDLSDAEWSIVAPLLPNKPRRVSRVNDFITARGANAHIPTQSNVRVS